MKIKSSVLFDVFNYLLMTSFFIITIYPLYYIFIYSISDPVLAQKGVYLYPVGVTLSNYKTIFMLNGIWNAALISVLRTVIGTVITVVCCTFFAYLVTQEDLPCRKFFYRFLVITMYLNSGLIPWFLTMKAYHLDNNFLLYVVPGAVSAYYVILIKTYQEQLPHALMEAAKIDGAGYITIFLKIVLPLSLPIVATIAVFASVGQWNSWQDNFFLVQSDNLETLQLMLYNFLNQANQIAQRSMEDMNRMVANQQAPKITPETVRMTITMVVTLPILFVYPFMQKYFVKGIMIGAIKG